MDLNRRTLLAGMAMGISSTAAYSRTITAQSSEWTETDLITLEGEIEVDERPYLGELNDINDSGEVCGALVASEQKISPLVWAANGKGKRLKSGEFGGQSACAKQQFDRGWKLVSCRWWLQPHYRLWNRPRHLGGRRTHRIGPSRS